MIYDVIIIGAGVVGASIARELSKFNLKTVLLEKNDDVSCGASKANSGIVHGGYDARPGSLKARMNVAGNRMFEKLNGELNFGYSKIGSLVLSFSSEEDQILYKLMDQGKKNNVQGMTILNRDIILKHEPYVSEAVTLGFYCSEAGIASPYEMVIALVENAITNGVELILNSEVTGIVKSDDIFTVSSGNSHYKSKVVINSSGIFSDRISELAGAEGFHILPAKGQYLVFDQTQGYLARTVLFQVPGKRGKGILVTPTCYGNLMIGPNSEDTENREDLSTDSENLDHIFNIACKSIPDINLKKKLKTFSGLRAKSDKNDFIIEESELVSGFINVAGIDSPGLTSSPAIAGEVINILDNCGIRLKKNSKFDGYRKSIIIKKKKNFTGKTEHDDPDKHIICRCEKVTKSEILDSLKRGIPVTTTEAVRRRTRAGMGFCQGKFCKPRVEQLIQSLRDDS